MENLSLLPINKFYFYESSFIEYIKIGSNFNILEIKMKYRSNIYIYEILEKKDILEIQRIYLNQDFKSIGKYYNELKRSGKIRLIDKL